MHPANKAERRALGKKLVARPVYRTRVERDRTKYARKEKYRGQYA